jgi:hypothetical protein
MPIISNWGNSNCLSFHGWRWTFWPLAWPVTSSLFDLKYWRQTWLVMWSVSSSCACPHLVSSSCVLIFCEVQIFFPNCFWDTPLQCFATNLPQRYTKMCVISPHNSAGMVSIMWCQIVKLSPAPDDMFAYVRRA